MKLFQVTITDKKLVQYCTINRNEQLLEVKYKAKYRFYPNVAIIKIERLTRKPGQQTDLLTQIEEIENGND